MEWKFSDDEYFLRVTASEIPTIKPRVAATITIQADRLYETLEKDVITTLEFLIEKLKERRRT